MNVQDYGLLAEDVLRTGFGIEAVDIGAGPQGLDAEAFNFTVLDVGGRRFFLKQAFDFTTSPDLSFALSRQGVQGVLAPLSTTTGDLAWTAHGKSYLLFPFVEGTNGFERPLTWEEWTALGRTFRAVHSCHVTARHGRGFRSEDWNVEGTERFLQLIEGDLPPLLRSTIEAHRDEIADLIDRTEAIGRRCRDREWELVPCHGDAHVGNVVVDASGKVWTVDWDEARLAPRECDLIFFLGGGILGHVPECEAAFLRGYGEVVPDAMAMTYFRYARALEDVVSFTDDALDPEATDQDRGEAVKYLNAQFAPGSALRLAQAGDLDFR